MNWRGVAAGMLLGTALPCVSSVPAEAPVRKIPLRYTSPDKRLTAVIVPRGAPRDPATYSATDYEFALGVWRGHHRVSAKDFSTPTESNGRCPQFARWSPDSRFFVVSTLISGGHHPWEYPTCIYDRRRGRFYYLNTISGPIVRPIFHFVGGSTIVVEVMDYKRSSESDPFPGKTVKVSLTQVKEPVD